MPTPYGFMTSAEVIEERDEAEQRRTEVRKKEVARVHPLISAVLNDFINAVNLPDLYFDRNGSIWTILYDDAVVYSLKIVQQGKELWLEYTDAELRKLGADEQYACIAVNVDKLPAVLKLLLEVDIRQAGSPG